MKRIFFLIGLLLPCLAHSGLPNITALRIGDYLPSITTSATVNIPGGKISLDNYKGKLVILDFWATNCSSCIAGLSKLDSLQKLFGDQIQIISVTSEKKSVVKKFYSKTVVQRPPLPTITDDSLLHKYFPYATIPHLVWIDKTGKVISFTYSEYLTAENIRSVLSGNEINLPQKTDKIRDYSLPFLKPDIPLFPEAPTYYSTITGYGVGLVTKSGIDIDSSHQTIRRYATNWSVVELYLMAFNRLINFPRNQVILNLANPGRYLYTPDQGYKYDWERKYAHCYELRCPLTTTRSELQTYMIQDLNRYLHISATIKSIPVSCLILRQIIPALQIHHSNNKTSDTTGNDLHVTGSTVSALLYQLNNVQGIPPIIDSSGICKVQNIEINIPHRSIHALKAAFADYGFTLTEEIRSIDMLIITDQPVL
ncbi:TlpA family protein disulfide reductase [Chitinophaga silvatica]|uniref:TlpA family protein disulfide reductase n=1 Tax=Chitinophaga silvatica TaxID=2282649 RepID=A0A3E1YHC4_9BACT|nr:TlpA disulfide reductase family protein [Chitinophaga silvatica]RFS26782.1 TlpA family protein disulfide reductase [Chitinophaga silvatica]